jgi:RNA polymerase sigma-70 factor (ECF subfamily)
MTVSRRPRERGRRAPAVPSTRRVSDLSRKRFSKPSVIEDARPAPQEKHAGLSDEQIIARVRAGELDLFELLVRRHNQLVFRIGRTILRDNVRAEDLAQEAWTRAFEHLDQFAGRSRFSTWLSRIALHEAWTRARRDRRFETAVREPPVRGRSNPESAALVGELRSLIDTAVDRLPEDYRIVFMFREIEELSIRETAEALEITEQAVKTRLHRARGLLRRELIRRAGSRIRETFPFLARECDRIVAGVLARIGAGGGRRSRIG